MNFLKCLVRPGGGNLRAQFLSCYKDFWGCQVCFKYLSYTSNFVESFKRFWDGDAFFALKVAETDGITQPWLFFYLKFAGKDVLDQVISQASRAAIPLHMHIVPKALLTNVTCNMDYRSKGILELTVDSQELQFSFVRKGRKLSIHTHIWMGNPIRFQTS